MNRPVFHGYAPSEKEEVPFTPPLSLVISRQAGARGRTIAERAADLLGWQVVTQETLGYVTNQPEGLASIGHLLRPEQLAWVRSRQEELDELYPTRSAEPWDAIDQTILELAAQESCVIVGRGAGFILPESCRVHARIIGCRADRIEYIAQIERLSLRDAENLVDSRDAERENYVQVRYGRSLQDGEQYDLILNVSRLGVDGTARLLASAVHLQLRARSRSAR